MSKAFPGRADGQGGFEALRLVGVLSVVASGLLVARRHRPLEIIRNIAIWGGMAVVLALGFSFHDDLMRVGLRLRSELIPGYGVASTPRTLVLTESAGGGFHVYGQVNDAPVSFMIDTGASDIVLSPADAQRLGIDTAALHYDEATQTANGIGHGARKIVSRLTVGPITLTDAAVAINQTPMAESLLGMAFLRRLESFEIRGRQLVLKARP